MLYKLEEVTSSKLPSMYGLFIGTSPTDHNGTGIKSLSRAVSSKQLSRFYNNSDLLPALMVRVVKNEIHILHTSERKNLAESLYEVLRLSDTDIDKHQASLNNVTLILNENLEVIAVAPSHCFNQYGTILNRKEMYVADDATKIANKLGLNFLTPEISCVVKQCLLMVVRGIINNELKGVLIDGTIYVLYQTTVVYIMLAAIVKPIMGYIIHANEVIGGNAAELAFWYYLARTYPDVFEYLDNYQYRFPPTKNAKELVYEVVK